MNITRLSLFILFFGLSCPSIAQFKGVDWGSSRADVRAIYGASDLEQGDFMAYEFTLGGKDVYGIFYFLEDRLYKGAYLLNEEHSSSNQYLLDYNAFKNSLTSKYGQPSEEESVWLDDLYQDDVSDWGMAVSIGHLVQYSIWSLDATEIECGIQGDNFDVTVKILYSSKELEKWAEEIQKQQTLDDF